MGDTPISPAGNLGSLHPPDAPTWTVALTHALSLREKVTLGL